MSYAADSGTGCVETMLTVPLTRGSSRKLRFSIWPTAVATDSMSALTKFSVTRSSSAAPTGAASSAHSSAMRTRRLAARTALKVQPLQRAVVAHQYVVAVHFLQHVSRHDRFADRRGFRLAVLERKDRAARCVVGRHQADQAQPGIRQRLDARARDAEQLRLDRRGKRAPFRARREAGGADRARSERKPRRMREKRSERGDEPQFESHVRSSSSQPVLQPADHRYIVYIARKPPGESWLTVRAGADSR